MSFAPLGFHLGHHKLLTVAHRNLRGLARVKLQISQCNETTNEVIDNDRR